MIKADTVGNPDVFEMYGSKRPKTPTNVSTNYVDGVSVTHGMNPRHHIWTMTFYGESVDCSCEIKRPSSVVSDFLCYGNHCMMRNTSPRCVMMSPVLTNT